MRASQTTCDPPAQSLLDRLLAAGYVVIEDAVGPDTVSAIRADLDRALPATPTGRNDFEGYRTKRVYSLLAKAPTATAIIEHHDVLALLDALLLPGYLLSALLAIDLHPAETPQPLHYDDGFYVLPRPRASVGISTIWAIDEFTRTNGATEVVAGSHTLGDQRPLDEAAVPVCMQPGSVLVMLGTLWHRGGANRSHRPRLAVTAQYCQPWARQQEQMMLATPPEVVRASSPRIQSMLGYSIHPPHMGHINGLHPRRLLDPGYDQAAHDDRTRAAEFWKGTPADAYRPAAKR